MPEPVDAEIGKVTLSDTIGTKQEVSLKEIVRDETDAFGVTISLLKKISALKIHKDESQVGIGVQIKQDSPAKEEEKLSATEVKVKMDALPGEVEERYKSSQLLLQTAIPEALSVFEQVQIKSVGDIDQMNASLGTLTSVLSTIKTNMDLNASAGSEARRLITLYIAKTLEENGIDISGGVDQALVQIRNEQQEKIAEIIRLQKGFLGWYRNRKALAQVSSEYRRLSDLNDLRYQGVNLPYLSQYEMGRELDALTESVGVRAVSNILSREDQLLKEVVADQSGESELKDPLPQSVVDSLNAEFINTHLMPELIREREWYKEAAEKNPDYRQTADMFSDEQNIELVKAVIYKAWSYKYSDKDPLISILRGESKERDYMDDLGELPAPFSDLARRFLKVGANVNLQNMATMTGQYATNETRLAVIKGYRDILDSLTQLAEDPDVPSGIRRFTHYEFGQKYQALNKADLDKQLVDFASQIDVDLWELFKKNPGVRQILTPEALETFDQAIGSTILSELLAGRDRIDRTISLGHKLLHFPSTEAIPVIILNASRESGHSGEYPFMSYHAQSSRDTLLYKFVANLSEDQLQQLEAQNIPGLTELISLIKNNPDTFRSTQSYDPENGKLVDNPVGIEVQKKLMEVAFHYFKNGDDKTKLYMLGVIEKAQAPLPEGFSEILNLMQNAPRVEFLDRAFEMLQNRASFLKDTGAIKALNEYLLACDDDRSFDKGLNSLINITGSIANYTRNLREDTPGFTDAVLAYESLLTRADRMTVGQTVMLLRGLNNLRINNVDIAGFFRSNLLSERIKEMMVSNPKEVSEYLINRLGRFGDENAFNLLTRVMSEIDDSTVRFQISQSITDYFLVAYDESPQSLDFKMQFSDRLLSLLDSDDLALRRHASQVLSQVVGRIFLMRPDNASTKQFYQDLGLKLTKSALDKLKLEDDMIVKFYLYDIANRQGFSDTGRESYLTLVLPFAEQLESYEKGTKFALIRLAKSSAGNFSREQIDAILESGILDSDLLVLFSFHNKLSREQEKRFLEQGFNPKLNDNNISYLLDESGEVTADNYLRLLTAYIKIRGNDQIRIDPEKTTALINLFSTQENKNLCLQELRNSWLSFLQDPALELPSLSILSLSNAIAEADVAANLRFIESYGRLIYQMYTSFTNPHTVLRTKMEVKEGLLKAENRFRQERWSEEDRANFNDISADILQAAPSLFSEYLSLVNDFSPDETRRFVREYYPFYQAQLVIIQKGENDKVSYSPRQLSVFRENIRHFKGALNLAGTDKEKRQAVFDSEKKSVITFVQNGFKDRFGLLKIPDQLEAEDVRTIQNFVRFLGNMAYRTEDKETILAFYLGLTLNDQWESFRRGEPVSIDGYFEGNKLSTLKYYLQRRAEYSEITPQNLNLNAAEFSQFMAILQDETISTITGNVETIDQKLGSVVRNLEGLADPDIYPDAFDRHMLNLLRTHGRVLGGVLAKLWQIKSGRNIQLSPEEQLIEEQIVNIEGINLSTPQAIKEVQDRIGPLRHIANMLNFAKEEKVDEKITGLHERLNPPDDVVAIFNRLGEEFKPQSGALALSQDLMYLENIIVKDQDKLSDSEKTTLSEYLDGIRDQMKVLEKTMQEMKDRIEAMKSGTKDSPNAILKARIAEIDGIINRQDTATNIVTRVTSNPNLIIENMRQCLGCLSKEINNDTNLTFGDTNKFYVMSQSNVGERGSIADEIAFFVPISINGASEFSFVLDNVYGVKSSDILLSHILAVFKKYRQVKDRFPNIPVSVYISSAAMNSGGVSSEILMQRLKEQVGTGISMEAISSAKVTVPQSASGDHYIEFGGGVRQAGTREVGGVLIK